MTFAGRRRAVAFLFIGIVIASAAVALNIGWIVVSWRTGMLFVLGLLFFCIVIAGVILNTIFLVREARQNDQHTAFINSVTHELKTPVASIRLYLETLQSREVDAARRNEFYRMMLEDSDRLLRTINQVLQAARSGSAVRRHLPLPVDMVELARECVEITRRRHHLADGALRLAPRVAQDRRAMVRGDPDDLQTAVLNLLDNAVKYSGSNIDVEVVVTLPEAGRLVVLTVRDRGMGISGDQLKRVFRRFYRVPESVALRIGGTGLGLFIVRSVVERHGGRAWAASDGVGQGSTFTLELPVLATATGKASAA